jgi:hypothetical protein
MKNLEEIDEEFKSLLDLESDKLKFKLGDLKNRAKFGDYNQEFKKNVSLLIKKKEKEINNFVSKHKDKLFPSEDKKEEILESGPRYLDVKHLNLELTKRERLSIQRSIKKFKFKLWWSNFYYYVIPSWIFFRLFRLRFKISNFFKDFWRSIGYFFRRCGKKSLDFFNRFISGIKLIFDKILILFNKFIGLFVRKKKEEGEKEITTKSGEANELKVDDENKFLEKKEGDSSGT